MSMAAIQAAQSLCTFVLGLSIGFLYDLYRLLLPPTPHKHPKRRLVFDTLWWCVITVWSFAALYRISWAELRLPLLAALLLGTAVYLYYFSPALKHFLAALLAMLKKTVAFLLRFLAAILRLLFWPFVKLTGVLYLILAAAATLVRFVWQKRPLIHKKNKTPPTQDTGTADQ